MRIFFCCLPFIAFVFSLGALAQSSSPNKKIYLDLLSHSITVQKDLSFSTEGLIGSRPIDFEYIKSNSDKYEDYQGFLDFLYLEKPNLFQYPVFLHHSGSLQQASFNKPRVLLFGDGAILGFSGEENNSTQSVEMININPKNLKFETSQIVFQSGEAPVLTKSPGKCIGCHGSETRPIWLPYDIWPKALGALDGMSLLSSAEENAIDDFAGLDKRGLFSYLNWTSEKFTNNSLFTQYLQSLNFLYTMNDLRKYEFLKPFRFMFAASANGCGDSKDQDKFGRLHGQGIDIREFLPERIRQTFPWSLDQIYQDVLSSRETFQNTLLETYKGYFPGSNPEQKIAVTDRLDFEEEISRDINYLFFNLGLKIRKYSMGLGQNSYSMQVPTFLPMEWSKALYFWNADLFKESPPSVYIDDTTYINGVIWDCNTLKNQSLKALSSVDPSELSSPVDKIDHQKNGRDQTPMGQCIHCHITTSEGPRIPFNDSSALSKWLKKGHNFKKSIGMIKSGKMPKGSHLTKEEKDSLILVLNDFFNWP